MTHTAINRFRQLAYGQKQANWDPAMLAAAKEAKEEEDRLNAAAVGMRPDGSKASPQEVEDALAQRSYVAPAGRARAGLAVRGGVAVGGLSAILAALLSKKETMLRNAVIAGAVGSSAGMAGAVYGSLAKGALAERKRRKRRLATAGLDKYEDLN